MGHISSFLHHTLHLPYALNVRHLRVRLLAKTTYVFIHGLGDTADLWTEIIAKLPSDVNYIAADLLGFGDSPKPKKTEYSANIQARSVLFTCRRAGIFGPVVIVGHSLGALVGVEFARRHPFVTKRLVLCSPPIYDDMPGHKTKINQQNVLRRLYTDIKTQPKLVVNAYALGKRLHVINQSLQVTPSTLPAFMESLQVSIMNQHTLQQIEKLQQPITIIDGRLDVLTINPLLRKIVARHKNMTLITTNTGHVVGPVYQRKILQVLGYK